VQYWARAEFPGLLRQAIGQVGEYLDSEGLLRVPEKVRWQRVAQEQGSDPTHRVQPLRSRLRRIFEIDDRAPEALLREMCRRFMEPLFARGRVYPDVYATLAALRRAGLRTAILSNTPWGSPGWLWREEVVRLGLVSRVDLVVFCADVGWRKPAAPIFEYALSYFGVTPRETLFVGDDPRWDIAGPHALGIDAVLIDRRRVDTDAGAIHSLFELWDVLGWQRPVSYTLRPACREDKEFLCWLRAGTLREYVAETWGWDEAAQRARFERAFSPEGWQVVVVNGTDVGALQVERTASEIRLDNLQIAPTWQGRGLGSLLIGDLLAEAREQDVPVSLQVLKANPARRLYERLGFRTIGETETHDQMRAEP